VEKDVHYAECNPRLRRLKRPRETLHQLSSVPTKIVMYHDRAPGMVWVHGVELRKLLEYLRERDVNLFMYELVNLLN
jgi:hypothetical protein